MVLNVIVPVYNGARYIADALHSILDYREQASCAVNIVLINDGSSDCSEEICLDFSRRYKGITYIYQTNKGVSAARNAGLCHVFENCADDDWIDFLDADDVWHPDWTTAVKQCQSSEADIIGFGMAQSNERLELENEIIPEQRVLFGGADTAVSENRKSHFESYLYRCGHLFNYEIFYIPGVTNGEDLMFKYCAFFAANKIEYCSGMLYIYRKIRIL